MPSSPPNSKRAQILNNLQRQLLTILAVNGYSRDVQDVSFNVKTWTQVPEANTPVLYIIDEDEKRTYHPGKLIEVEWNVALYGVMKNQTQLDMEEFISDIETCLFSNLTLRFSDTGPVINHFRINSIMTDNQFFSEIDGSQLFKITLCLITTRQQGQR